VKNICKFAEPSVVSEILFSFDLPDNFDYTRFECGFVKLKSGNFKEAKHDFLIFFQIGVTFENPNFLDFLIRELFIKKGNRLVFPILKISKNNKNKNFDETRKLALNTAEAENNLIFFENKDSDFSPVPSHSAVFGISKTLLLRMHSLYSFSPSSSLETSVVSTDFLTKISITNWLCGGATKLVRLAEASLNFSNFQHLKLLDFSKKSKTGNSNFDSIESWVDKNVKIFDPSPSSKICNQKSWFFDRFGDEFIQNFSKFSPKNSTFLIKFEKKCLVILNGKFQLLSCNGDRHKLMWTLFDKV
jgi:hypothetical protein